ncbi:poly(U)-specific 3'-to-5' RNA exonuclease [Thecaphora frezii]
MPASHPPPGLVDYADSNSGSDSDTSTVGDVPRPSRGAVKGVTPTRSVAKRRLPPLGDDLAPRTVVDAPSFTKKPKLVVGEWLCHVFVEVPPQPSLDRVIRQCHEEARRSFGPRFSPTAPADDAGTWVAIRSGGGGVGEPADGDEDGEADAKGDGQRRLHISLTRPILLRAHERTAFVDEAVEAIRSACRASDLARFPVSFSRLDHLTNDDLTRDFLVLEVGAGWRELRALVDSLSDALYRLVRAKPYYEEARFHASVGFVALEELDSDSAKDANQSPIRDTVARDPPNGHCRGADTAIPPTSAPVHGEQVRPGAVEAMPGRTCSPLAAAAADLDSSAGAQRDLPWPEARAPTLGALVEALQSRYAAAVRSCPPFMVSKVGIRVGKRVSWVDLRT